MWNRGGDEPSNDPLSLLTPFAASSPKGTPLRYAGNLIATTKSRPLGEGGIAVGDDGRGNFRFSHPQKLKIQLKNAPDGSKNNLDVLY